jgi:hypothetical protein
MDGFACLLYHAFFAGAVALLLECLGFVLEFNWRFRMSRLQALGNSHDAESRKRASGSSCANFSAPLAILMNKISLFFLKTYTVGQLESIRSPSNSYPRTDILRTVSNTEAGEPGALRTGIWQSLASVAFPIAGTVQRSPQGRERGMRLCR